MGFQISVFLPFGQMKHLNRSIESIRNSGMEAEIYVLAGSELPVMDLEHSVKILSVSDLYSTDTVKKIALHAKTPFIAIYSKQTALVAGSFLFQRMIQVAENTFAGMVYSDYYQVKEGKSFSAPVIDYQEGSLRDDFNFGPLTLYESTAFIETVSRMKKNYIYGGFYDLRLKLSQKYDLFHIPEFLYNCEETDLRRSGEKQFDYVDPKNRDVQKEMEQICTLHLKETGAWLPPRFKKVHFDESRFITEATVIIPVKNRDKTIADAIESVINQQTNFSFNLIVVDNHSTDHTGNIIESYADNDRRIVHHIPESKDLGIGGCWNEAIFHPACGKFAIQLDSDDLYIDNSVISRMVDAFYAQNCAMIVGTYKMVDFKLQEIPPGIIDHKEWTPENGRNNALRINGLGAPRAFYTPVLRSIRMPNVSYGEDYAVGLNISRYYQIGRIYEPLYLCRRWEENSDASLDMNKLNAYNYYKDRIRTIEIRARQQFIQNSPD